MFFYLKYSLLPSPAVLSVMRVFLPNPAGYGLLCWKCITAAATRSGEKFVLDPGNWQNTFRDPRKNCYRAREFQIQQNFSGKLVSCYPVSGNFRPIIPGIPGSIPPPISGLNMSHLWFSYICLLTEQLFSDLFLCLMPDYSFSSSMCLFWGKNCYMKIRVNKLQDFVLHWNENGKSWVK